MLNIKNLLTEFVEDESGLTAVEYAVAGGLVVGGMVLAFTALGDAATNRLGALEAAITP